MIPGFLLSLREGLEAALIIGIVLSALHKTGRSDLYQPLWVGVISAVMLSLLSALLLRGIGRELEGRSEQIFEGITLLLAGAVLTWMIFWMRQQSVSMKAQLESDVNQALTFGSRGTIFFLSFIAVLREGIELALYLTAISMTYTGIQTLLGAAIGLFVACLLGYLIFTTSLHLNMQRFFQVTAFILILFAAGLIAHGIGEFNEAGIIPSIINPIWNINHILDDRSLVGLFLRTLFGYNGNPSLTEALGYSGYILAIFWIFLKPKKLQPG